jgi:predicted lipoprotein with Yx(FWY)xxD motif
MMRRPTLLALAAVPALAVALSACGSNSSSTAGSTTPPSSSTGTSAKASSAPAASNAPAGAPSKAPAGSGGGSGIHVATTSLGQVLVDGQGRTLYMLTADKPGQSTCDASCLAYWPAVPPGSTSLKGVTGAVSSTAAIGGGKIATVGGWPLYTFIQDQKPGAVTGEGMVSFGGTWYAVSAAGQPVKAAAASGAYTSPAPAGGGY